MLRGRPARALLALAVLGWLGSGQLQAQFSLTGEVLHEDPVNILLIIADDLGVEGVGVYGEHPNPPRTPNIDALASRGLLFRNCWANPGCSPTRATLLTGRYSFRTGIGQAINYFLSPIELSPKEVGLPQVLDSRYRKVAFGKWHLAKLSESGVRHPKHFGFDSFAGSMKILNGFVSEAYYDWEKVTNGKTEQTHTYATTDTVNDALHFIEEADGPWFMWLAFHAPHSPFHKPPARLHGYDLPVIVKDDLALHMYAMMEALDTEIGRLLQNMDPEVRDNTVIIFVGDNGSPASVTVPPYNPKHAKNTLYEGGLNVPLIVAGPGVAEGAESGALVNTTDIFATVLDVSEPPLHQATAKPPADSVSFRPFFSDPGASSLRPWVYAERFLPNGFNPVETRRAMRENRFKLIQSLDHTDTVVLEELYDLVDDPTEDNDLMLVPALSPTTQVIYQYLHDEMAFLDPPSPWTHLDDGSVLKSSAPQLQASGSPSAGAVLQLSLTQAPANTLTLLVTGYSASTTVPYQEGVLHPDVRRLFPTRTDSNGRVNLAARWPAHAPETGALAFQFLFPAQTKRKSAANSAPPTRSNAIQLQLTSAQP